jgi:hypothetical protein
LPFWQFAQQQPQTEIPHVSRDPLWERPFGLDVIEQLIFVAIGVVGMIYAALRKRPLFMLAAGVTFFAILSMGTTTDIPKMLFGAQYKWLTYDKFHNWAGIWFCVLVAQWLSTLRVNLALPLTIALAPFALWEVSHKNSDALQPEFVRDVKPLLTVLNEPDARSYRHLTLGFGDQFCRLSILGQSPNVDGDYHTARTDPLLRSSGVATLDASKYYPEGPHVLTDVLSRANALSLRWVYVYDAGYYEYLLKAGYSIRDIWQSGVTLFENTEVPPILDTGKHENRWGLFWGLVPLTVLGLAMLLGLFEVRERVP